METVTKIKNKVITAPKAFEREGFYDIPLQWKIVVKVLAFWSQFAPKQVANITFKLFSKPRTRAIHKISDEIIESAVTFEVPFKDGQLKGYKWGADGLPIVFLLHGWESRTTALRHFVPDLLNNGYQVVGIDGPAHGDSDGIHTNIHDFAKAILPLIKQIKDNWEMVITHSFGGSVLFYILGVLRTDIELPKLVSFGTPSNLKGVFKRFHEFIGTSQKSFDLVYKKVEKLTLGYSVEELDWRKLKHKISIEQFMVVHDTKDSIVPFKEGKELAEWNNATLLETRGFGHFKAIKEERIKNEVLDFLNQ